MRQRVNLRSPLFLQYESRPAEVKSTNLQIYSEDFANAAWGKTNSSISSNIIEAPNGELTADKLIGAAVSVGKYTQDVVSGLSTSSKATFSIFLKESELNEVEVLCAQNVSPFTNWARCRFNVSNLDDKGTTIGDFSYEDYGNGWIRLSVTGTPVSTNAIIRITLSKDGITNFTGDGVSGIYIFGAQVEQQEQATSYIKTTSTAVTRAATTEAQEEDVTAELRIYSGGGGYNYERTNEITYSEEFNQSAWFKSNCTITANQISSPIGDLTADLATSTASGGGVYRFNSWDTTASTFSVFAKKKTSDTIEIFNSSSPSNKVVFDLTDGTIQTEGGTMKGSISDEGDGWYRITATYTATSSQTVGIKPEQNESVYLWGAQLEREPQATGYIKSGSTNGVELAYQTEAPTEATYTLTKSPENAKTTFEIAELIRDYIEQTTTKSSGTIWADVKMFDNLQMNRHYYFLGTEGYIDNTEGLQTYLNAPSNETFMQSNSTVLIPEGQSLEIPINAQYNSFYTITTGGVEGSSVYFSNLDDNSTQVEYITVNSTDEVVKLYVDSVVTEEITIQETECSKYADHLLMFVNKYGSKQDFYVNMKSTERFKIKDDGFSRSVIDYNTLSVNNGIHSYKRRVLESKETYTLNTPFLDEENVQAFEELLLSEYVWLKKEGESYIPVIVKDMSMTRKTHLNDKLIQYTVEVESANHLVNKQR